MEDNGIGTSIANEDILPYNSETPTPILPNNEYTNPFFGWSGLRL